MILSLKFARRSRPRSISNSRLLHTPMLLLLLVLPLQLQLLVPLLVLLDLTQLSSQPELPSVMLMQRLTHNCCLEDNLLVLPDMLLVLSQLLLLQLLLLPLPQQLLLLQETANRRLTDSVEVSQSSHPEPLLCQNVPVCHTVLLYQSVLQSQEPSLSPTVLLCQTVSVYQNAPLFQDRNVPQSPELSQTHSVLQSQSPHVTLSPDLFHRLSATPSQSPSAELSHSQSPWLFHVSSVHQSPEKSVTQSKDRLPGKSVLSTRPRPTMVMVMPLSSSLLLSQSLLLLSLLLSALLLLSNTVMEAPTTHMEIPTPLSLFPELTKNTIGSHTNNQYLSKAKLNFNLSNLLKLLILPTFSTCLVNRSKSLVY